MDVYEESFADNYRVFACKILEPVIHRFGYTLKPREAHTKTLARVLVLQTLGQLRHGPTVAWAKGLWKEGKILEKIPADLRLPVLATIASKGGNREWEQLQKLYLNVELSEEKERIGEALVSFTQKSLIEKSLKFLLSKNVRDQDTALFIGVASKNGNAALVWKFMQEHWNTLLEKYGHGGFLLSRMVESLGAASDLKIALQMERFFKIHPHPGCELGLAGALESIRINSDWLKRDKKIIDSYLKSGS